MSVEINSLLSQYDIIESSENIESVGNRLSVRLENETNRLIIDYREIPGSEYPHGLIFSLGPFTDKETLQNSLPDEKFYYHNVVRAPTIQAALNFLMNQLRRYFEFRSNGFK